MKVHHSTSGIFLGCLLCWLTLGQLVAQPTVTAFSLYRLSKTLDYTTSFTPGNPASATAIEVPTNTWTLELTFSEAVVPPGKGNPSFNTLAEITELLRLESGSGGVSGDLLTVASLAASVSAATDLAHSADGKTLRFSLKLKTALKPGHTYTLSLDPAKAVARADGTTKAGAFSAVFSTASAVQILPGGSSTSSPPTILCNSGRPKVLPPVIISEQSAGSFAVGKGKLVLAFDYSEVTITRAPTVTLVGAAGDFLLPTAKLSATGKQLEITYDFTGFEEVSGLMLSGMEVAAGVTTTAGGITVASLKPVGVASNGGFDHFTGLSSSTIFTQVSTTHLTTVGGSARPIKITGPVTVCQGSVSTGNRFTYVAAPVAGVTGYHWKLPTGFTTTDPDATLIPASGAYHTPDNQITLSVEPSAALGHHHELEVRSVSDCHLSVLARKLRIAVAPAPNPKVSLPAAKFANDLGSSVVITVTNSPAGGVGTLRGDGVVGDKLYPGLLRPGKGYKVYYDYSMNNCSVTAETSFEIYDPDAIIGGLLRAYCSDENAVKTVTIDDLAAASSVKLYSPRPGNVLIPLSSKLLAGAGTYEFTFNPKTLFDTYGAGTYRFEVIQASLPGTITTATFEIREPPHQNITGPGVVCGDEATIYNYASSVPASGSDDFLWEIVSENSKGSGNGYGTIVGNLDTGLGVSVIWKNGTVAGTKDTLRLTQIRGGCPTVTNYPIKIFAAPLPVIVGQRQVCPGEEVTYRLKKAGTGSSIRSTYEWHLSDSSDGVILGAINKETVTVNWGEGIGGMVMVTQRFQGGCEGSGNLFVATKLLPKLTIAGFDPANTRVFCAGDTNKVALTPVFDSDPALLPADYLTSGHFEIRRVSGAAKAPTPFLRIGGETLVKPIASRVAKTDFIPAYPISQEPRIVYSASTQETNQNVGEYVLRYVYTHPTKNCVIRSPAYKITIRPLPSLSFTGLVESYCGNDSPVVLSTFKNGVQTPVLPGFKVRHIATNQETRLSGTLLDPAKLKAGKYELILAYNGSVSECGNTSNRDSAVFFNVVAPPENLHIQASRDFNSDTLRFRAVAGSESEWQWNFGNLLASGAKVDYPVKLPAGGTGNGSISNVSYTLKATNRGGCEASFTQSFQVDFSFVGRCLGEVTHFTDKSSILGQNISSWQWDFGDGTEGVSIQHPSHHYKQAGTYWVSLTIGTQIPGVVSGKHQMFYTLRRRIDIFPVIEVTATKPYLETFAATKGSQGWISHGVVAGKQDLSSWQLKEGSNGSGAWATTGNTESYYPLEQSYVESPCFEISGLPRPMLSFDYQLDTDPGADGVVLLYSVDDGGSWYRLGNVGDGIHWYNSKSILGRPGQYFSAVNENGQGWSGRSKSPAWQTARLSLDEVLAKIKELGILGQNKQRVRFRFALGSNADNPPGSHFKGFAFDNVAITSRNRQVLLEYFINESLSSAATLDAQVRDLALALPEAIPLHYHTDFPGKDSFNEANDKDPSARVFHYGIRAVPRMVVDGGSLKDSLPNLKKVARTYAKRILTPSPFMISLSSSDRGQKSGESTLNFAIKITALKAFARPVVVHLVLVDTLAKSSGNGDYYHHIVRQMLPDGAGTFVKARNWRPGDSLRLNLAWDYKRYPVSLDLTTLQAVVFIQDYESKEVYQAITSKVVLDQRNKEGGNQVIGVSAKTQVSGKLHLSPNPGSKQVRLRLPREWTPGGKLHWSIQTLGGKMVKRGRVQGTARDSTTLILDTSKLAEGVYIIQVQIGQERFWQRFEKINR